MNIPAENIHWLFGTSLQVIATFVGLLAAAFFFFHDRLESERDKNETLREIYDEIRRQHYRRFKALFGITATSIVMGFWVLYLAAAGIVWHISFIVALVGLLHIFNLALAGWFFIVLVNPDIVQNTAQKLVKSNTDLFNRSKDHGMSQAEFISKFWGLEKILRAIATKANIGMEGGQSSSFADLIQELQSKGIINNEQLKELNQISKVRNISAHSEVKNIERDLGVSADKLNRELTTINEKK